jgi:hypothetical protein
MNRKGAIGVVWAVAAAFAFTATPASADPATIDELLAVCPTADEVAHVDQDLKLIFDADPTRGEPLACTAAGGSVDLTLFQKRAYHALLAMQHIPFDAPLPWTPLPLYDWFRTTVRGVHFRSDVSGSYCCEDGPLIVVQTGADRAHDNSCELAGSASRWGEGTSGCGLDGLMTLLVHEARHVESGMHTCDTNDQTLDEMGAWAVQYWLERWLADHAGTYLQPVDGRPIDTYRVSARNGAHDVCSLNICAQGCPDEGLGAISGTVTDAVSGEPLSDVRVLFFARGARFRFRGVTDSSGHYTTHGIVPTGSYAAEAFDHPDGIHVNELYDDVPCASGCPLDSGKPVAVAAPTETAGIDFALSRGGRIAGTVTDEDTHAPIVGRAAVRIYTVPADIPVDIPLSDATGHYTSNVLPPGRYFATASPLVGGGYTPKLWDDVPCSSCSPTSGTPIDVSAGATHGGIDFRLRTTRPRLSISDVRVTESLTTPATAVFTVVLAPPADGDVTVSFATADGTAQANIDYRPVTGTLTFPVGTASQTIAVPIIGDVVNETDETFFVNLSGATGAVIGKGQGLGTIANDPTATLFTLHRVLSTRSFDVVLSGPLRIDSYNSSHGPWGSPCAECAGGLNVASHGDVQSAGRVVRTPDVVVKGKIAEHAPSLEPPIPLPSGAKSLGHFSLAGSQKVVLAAGSYVAETFTMNDEAQLTAAGPVKIWVRQAINLAGSAKTKVQNGRAADLWLIGLPGMVQANLNAAVRFDGVLYTPDAVINVAGSCTVSGGLAGAGLMMSGDSRVHFDEALAGASSQP